VGLGDFGTSIGLQSPRYDKPESDPWLYRHAGGLRPVVFLTPPRTAIGVATISATAPLDTFTKPRSQPSLRMPCCQPILREGNPGGISVASTAAFPTSSPLERGALRAGVVVSLAPEPDMPCRTLKSGTPRLRTTLNTNLRHPGQRGSRVRADLLP